MTDDLKTMPTVDLHRYLGTWYEIARKPMRHEDATARDITATYELDAAGAVRVVNSCINADGEVETAEGQAMPVDTSTAKLEVTFLPQGLRWIPFTKGDYWILRVDEGYNTALVGVNVYFQAASYDVMAPGPLPFATTNALHVSIQP